LLIPGHLRSFIRSLRWCPFGSIAARIAIVIALVGGSARAQGNYRSAALGGRSALMGDTGVALGSDGAAPFLNPATVVVQVQSGIALSINFVGRVVHAPNWYVPGAVDSATYGNVPRGGADITRISGNAIPSTLCVFLPLRRIGTASEPEGRAGTQKLAACFGTTELDQFDWVGQGYQRSTADRSLTQSSSVRHTWQRFVIAPSYAVHVSETLALGVSIQGSLTNIGAFEGDGATTAGVTPPPTSSVFQSGLSGSDLGLSGLFGAIFTHNRFTIGATVQSPDISVYGHGNVSDYTQFAGASSAATTYLGEGTFHAREPTRFSLGAGHRWPMGTSIEVDAQFALASPHALELDSHGTQLVTPGTASPASLLLTTRYQPTFNASVGGEFYLSQATSLLGGLGTDLSAVAALTPTSVASSRINRLLVSFGVASHGDKGTVMAGVQGYFGFGEALAPNVYATEPTLTPTPTQTYGMLFIFAGAIGPRAIPVTLGSIRNAIQGP
jgi:hypothetical protein